jgi:hypothetical protein
MITTSNCVVHKVILLNHASVGLPVASAFANFLFMQSLSGLCASSELRLTQTTEPPDKLQRPGATRRSDFRRTYEGALYCAIPVFLLLSWIIEGYNSFIQKLWGTYIFSYETICIFLALLLLITSYSFIGK